MNLKQTGNLVLFVQNYWPSLRVNEVTCEAWHRVLCDLDGDLVLNAVVELGNSGREFAPSPGQVRIAAIEMIEGATPDADEAWAEIRSQVSRVGYVGKPQFSHPAIASAVEAMGWRALCAGEEMIDRAHFMKLYGAVRDRSRSEAVMLPTTRAALGRVRVEHPILPEGVAHVLESTP